MGIARVIHISLSQT
jgi:hypothetical protein